MSAPISLVIAHAGGVVTGGARGSALASWTELWVFGGIFVGLVALVVVRGRGAGGPLFGFPARLEARTGVPGWAATTLLCSIYGLVVAGFGFYTDVAWHVALGRDDVLFTAPHAAIFGGLCLIAVGPIVGVFVARADRERHPWTGDAPLPRSLLPLSVLGTAALIGFPVDELWHQAYGVDVTMWSPPHLIMILAASFSGLASWLVLADAGVRPSGRWGRGLHLVTAALTLQGLSSVQGEFSFGVPQWQQLYHPVLIALAGGLALVLIRLVHGRGWALGVATGVFLFGLGDVLGGGGPIETRMGATYLGAAVAVEAIAALVGTERRLRFALLSGLGVGTVGLGVEWLWNQGAHQPWTIGLLPEAVVVGLPAAVAAAVLGAALAGAIGVHRGAAPVPAAAVALAVVVVLVSLVVPGPRRTGDVTAAVSLDWVDDDHAVVEVALDPPDAADGARWFTVGSWQWGGRTIRHMKEVAPGHYTSGEPIELAGRAKSLLRLHRGAEMMAVAIRLPPDDEYDLPAVPAEDRTAPFVAEQQYLQREADAAGGWLAALVYALIVVLGAAWIASLAWTTSRIGRVSPRVPNEQRPASRLGGP